VKTCTTSDFFIEEADAWRPEAWQYIHSRPDLTFLIITKRPERIAHALPEDWDAGYGNVRIGVSVESQYTADRRVRILLSLPILEKSIVVEPMLGPVRLSKYLETGEISSVSCGGESGPHARVCDFSWVLDLMLECVRYNVPFRFTQTGGLLKKGDRIYTIGEKDQAMQAEKAGVNYGEVVAV
jgi:protein gp37